MGLELYTYIPNKDMLKRVDMSNQIQKNYGMWGTYIKRTEI